jgi:hypothetical protein
MLRSHKSGARGARHQFVREELKNKVNKLLSQSGTRRIEEEDDINYVYK